ncbi:MAG TPA: TspO/MBR family protein [Chloroflexota bacterium]|nr:TspO/MBR family protein [Chloroflexota bacterium]
MSSEMLMDLRALISAIVVCEGAGGVGALVTGPAVRTWYPGLRKPAFNPPSWIFAPVWTVLYLLMGVSLFLTWRRRSLEARAAPALRIFTLQLLLNALWSMLFFGLKSPRFAFMDIVILWAAIILTIRAMYRVSRVGALLLLPYLVWVSFAGLLNLAIWRLNA